MNPNNRQLKRIGPVADAFIKSRAFIQGIMGPVGSGKTIASSQKLLLLAARQGGVRDKSGCVIRRARFAFIRDTYPNLDRNTIPSWWKVVPKERGAWNGSAPRIHRFGMVLRRDGSGRPIDVAQVECEFRAIGEASVEDALRGLEVTAAFVNEADRTHPDILTFLAGRVGRFGDLDPTLVVDPQIILDLNGNDDDNWTYKVLVLQDLSEDLKKLLAETSGGQPLIEYFEQPEAVNEHGEPNPAAENIQNLPPGYYARQYALAKMKGNITYINRMLRSRFVPLQAGMPVFPEYIDSIHSGEFPAIPGVPLILMADQGLLGAALVGQVVKGQLRILEEFARVFETEDDELVVSQMGGETFGEEIREFLAVNYPEFRIGDAVCDPAGAAGEDLINQVKTSTNPNYCVRVTASDGAIGDQWLRTFQDNDKTIPTILTTSQKLSTGVDARNVRNIVLMRPVKSMIEFKQIIGRGTRLFDGKDYFTILDFVKAYEHFNDPEWDGEPLEPDPPRPPGPGKPEGDPPEPPEPGPDPEPPKAKLVIRLADGKDRAFQHISATTFWSVDGRPVSAQQFIQDLFGQLPDLFRDEDELRAIWSQPDTRRKLVEGLAERGFTGEALDGIRRATDSQESDLFDVLAFIAWARPPLKRIERADTRREAILSRYDDKQRDFLDFVLSQYATVGESELDDGKLPALLELKYGTPMDAVRQLGSVAQIRSTFLGFQRGLYEGEGKS